MILFQLNQWMEERQKLAILIKKSDGSNQLWVRRKEQVEKLLLLQASRWLVGETKHSIVFESGLLSTPLLKKALNTALPLQIKEDFVFTSVSL